MLLAGANTVDALVVYLAALAAGHPVLLAPHDRPDFLRSLTDAYDPDVVAFPDGTLDERRAGSAHTLHPDLALLLSTSGSTGSPKLVRLSHENLRSNAESIAAYLDIRPGDRAATTLPMHYCYGLSVVNSHLLRGAGLILTDLSVADDRFWALFRDARGTALAGVPYTFELLDRVGFADMRLPSLRYVTQAGGRLPADRVARYAALGRRRGWDLVVMYGQTEATARMAYLPPNSPPPTRRRSASRSPAGPSGWIRRRTVPRPAPASWCTRARTSCSATPAAPPTWPSAAPSRTAHRRSGTAAARRAVRDRGTPQPTREAVRPAHRPAARRGGARRARPDHILRRRRHGPRRSRSGQRFRDGRRARGGR